MNAKPALLSRKLWIAATALAIVVTVAIILRPEDRSLRTELLRTQRGTREFDRILLRAGSNALPTLESMMQEKDGPLAGLYRKFWPKLPASWRKNVHVPVEAAAVRSTGITGIQLLDGDVSRTAPTLINIVASDPSGAVRSEAARALGTFYRRSPQAARAVEAILAGNNTALRQAAWNGVCSAGPLTREMFPLCMTMLGVKAHESPKSSMRVLVEALHDPARRQFALKALQLLGPEAGQAVPDLVQLLTIGDGGAPSERGARETGRNILEIFFHLQPNSHSAITAVKSQVGNIDPVLNCLAVATAARMEGDCRAAIPALVPELYKWRCEEMTTYRSNLDGMNYDNPALAAWLLGELGPPARAALPDLYRALHTPLPDASIRIAEAIWKIEGKADAVLPVLVDRLSFRGLDSQFLAIRTLAEMGESARPAIPALRKCRNDSIAARREADAAVLRIEAR